MFFRGKKFAVRLVLVLLVTLVVVVIQIISVSRISSPTPYPWELPLDDRRDIGRDLRAVPTLNSAVSKIYIPTVIPKLYIYIIVEMINNVLKCVIIIKLQHFYLDGFYLEMMLL